MSVMCVCIVWRQRARVRQIKLVYVLLVLLATAKLPKLQSPEIETQSHRIVPHTCKILGVSE